MRRITREKVAARAAGLLGGLCFFFGVEGEVKNNPTFRISEVGGWGWWVNFNPNFFWGVSKNNPTFFLAVKPCNWGGYALQVGSGKFSERTFWVGWEGILTWSGHFVFLRKKGSGSKSRYIKKRHRFQNNNNNNRNYCYSGWFLLIFHLFFTKSELLLHTPHTSIHSFKTNQLTNWYLPVRYMSISWCKDCLVVLRPWFLVGTWWWFFFFWNQTENQKPARVFLRV